MQEVIQSKERILRLRDVITRTGLCRTAIYAMMNEKAFPNSIKLGARRVGWLESDIDKWIKYRIDFSRVVSVGIR